MSSKINRLINRLRYKARYWVRKQKTHGELIEELISASIDIHHGKKIFVETGCGVSTISLGKCGSEGDVTIYTCDINSEKADELKELSGPSIGNVQFRIGSSLDSLESIAQNHDTIDFLFLDSAASAMYTFQEFMTVEKCLKTGSVLLIDNAAIPGEKHLLSPVRKGKILVPYLLASRYWEVQGHPDAGDSMVSAIKRDSPDYADPMYEDPGYIDHWRAQFNKEID